MLMAIAMPIFSLRRMERVMIVGQGINARTRSITPLYAVGKSVSSLTTSLTQVRENQGDDEEDDIPPEARL